MSKEKQPPAKKQIDPWAAEHIRNLNDLILEMQGQLIAVEPSGSRAARYNYWIRKSISAVQDLRDEIGSWSRDTPPTD